MGVARHYGDFRFQAFGIGYEIHCVLKGYDFKCSKTSMHSGLSVPLIGIDKKKVTLSKSTKLYTCVEIKSLISDKYVD